MLAVFDIAANALMYTLSGMHIQPFYSYIHFCSLARMSFYYSQDIQYLA